MKSTLLLLINDNLVVFKLLRLFVTLKDVNPFRYMKEFLGIYSSKRRNLGINCVDKTAEKRQNKKKN